MLTWDIVRTGTDAAHAGVVGPPPRLFDMDTGNDHAPPCASNGWYTRQPDPPDAPPAGGRAMVWMLLRGTCEVTGSSVAHAGRGRPDRSCAAHCVRAARLVQPPYGTQTTKPSSPRAQGQGTVTRAAVPQLTLKPVVATSTADLSTSARVRGAAAGQPGAAAELVPAGRSLSVQLSHRPAVAVRHPGPHRQQRHLPAACISSARLDASY